MRVWREFVSFIKGFGYATRGIARAIASERNLRFHICMAVYVVFFSVIGNVSSGDFAKFAICFAVVMAAELVNSAIERICDMTTKERDERVRDIKDIAAGAVLVCAIASAFVGLSVFLRADVFGAVMKCFTENTWTLAVFVLSVPIALLFVLKRGEK